MKTAIAEGAVLSGSPAGMSSEFYIFLLCQRLFSVQWRQNGRAVMDETKRDQAGLPELSFDADSRLIAGDGPQTFNVTRIALAPSIAAPASPDHQPALVTDSALYPKPSAYFISDDSYGWTFLASGHQIEARFSHAAVQDGLPQLIQRDLDLVGNATVKINVLKEDVYRLEAENARLRQMVDQAGGVSQALHGATDRAFQLPQIKLEGGVCDRFGDTESPVYAGTVERAEELRDQRAVANRPPVALSSAPLTGQALTRWQVGDE